MKESETIRQNKKRKDGKHYEKDIRVRGLDCATARKDGEAIKKLPGVKRVSVNFMTQKMILDAEDSQFDEILQAAVKCIAKVEPDCRVVL